VKTVILFGSPRKDGNTIELVNAFSGVLRDNGHGVRTLYLNDMNIRPCQGCLACLPKGICRINDDMKDIRKYIKESDLIVFASPVYWFGVSAQLKAAIDRSLAFMNAKFGSRIKGKKTVTLMTCADKNADVCSPAIAMFRMTFDLLGLTYAGGVEATGCEGKGQVDTGFKESARRLAESIA
jgi:multimeric flavodoxin WrbA